MTPTPKDLKNAQEPPGAKQTTHLGKPAYISGIRLEHSPKYPYTVTAFEIICCDGVFLERLQEHDNLESL